MEGAILQEAMIAVYNRWRTTTNEAKAAASVTLFITQSWIPRRLLRRLSELQP